jgi:hypothetical protein
MALARVSEAGTETETARGSLRRDVPVDNDRHGQRDDREHDREEGHPEEN